MQFIEPLDFRVIRVHDWPTYSGWVWLDGYELNAAGEAVERRSIFVQVSGLQGENAGRFARTEPTPAARRRSLVDAGTGQRGRQRQPVN